MKLVNWRGITMLCLGELALLLCFDSVSNIVRHYHELVNNYYVLIGNYQRHFQQYADQFNKYGAFFNTYASGGIIGEVLFTTITQLFNELLLFLSIIFAGILFFISLLIYRPDLFNIFKKQKTVVGEENKNKDFEQVADREPILEEAKPKQHNDPKTNTVFDIISDSTIDNYKLNKGDIDIYAKKITNYITFNKIHVKLKNAFTMPLYSMIEFEAKNETGVDDIIKRQKDFIKILGIDQFIIKAKGREIVFEFKNRFPSRVCLKSIIKNDPINLPLGIGLTRNPIYFNTHEKNSLIIYGKHGSGVEMIMSNLLLTKIALTDLNKHEIFIFSPTISTMINSFSRINLLKNNIYSGRERCLSQIQNLLTKNFTERTFIVIQEFDLIAIDQAHLTVIINLIKKIKNANGTIIISCKSVNTISHQTSLTEAIDEMIVLNLTSKKDSEEILESDKAYNLYGNGDGFIVYKHRISRFQSCYLSSGELKTVIDAINQKYQITYVPVSAPEQSDR
jgi:hypothetical protein